MKLFLRKSHFIVFYFKITILQSNIRNFENWKALVINAFSSLIKFKKVTRKTTSKFYQCLVTFSANSKFTLKQLLCCCFLSLVVPFNETQFLPILPSMRFRMTLPLPRTRHASNEMPRWPKICLPLGKAVWPILKCLSWWSWSQVFESACSKVWAGRVKLSVTQHSFPNLP